MQASSETLSMQSDMSISLGNITARDKIILNGFKVIGPTRFCHRNWYLQSSDGNNSKLYTQELWFLHSACHPMLVNISMKFHEDILNGVKVIERTQFCHRNCYLQSSKEHNSNNIYPIKLMAR